MISEYDVQREIEQIEQDGAEPIAKARRLLELRRRIEKFARRLSQGCQILEKDGEVESAERLAQTRRNLKRLQEEVRLAAFRVLKTRPVPLGFGYEMQPSRAAGSEASDIRRNTYTA
jgi:hypothetical protein